MPTEFNFSARHLSASEIFSDELQSLGGNALVYAALIRSEVKITQGALVSAMKSLCRIQPALRMRILTDARKSKASISKRFVEMTNVTVEAEVHKGDDRKSWVRFAEKELSVPFEATNGPLWKLSYVEFNKIQDGLPPLPEIDEDDEELVELGMNTSSEPEQTVFEGAILFKVHHVIADGVSLFHFLRGQVLPTLNDILGQSKEVTLTPRLTMIPPADDSFAEKNGSKPSGLRRRFSLKKDQTAKKTLMEASKNGNREPLFKVPVMASSSASVISSVASTSAADPDLRTRVLPFAHPSMSTTHIIEASMEHGCNVHATLLTAASLALAAEASLQKFDIGDEILCGFPVDLRQYRTISSPHPLGQWLGYSTVKIKGPSKLIDVNKFWKEAKLLSNTIGTDTKPGKIFSAYKDAVKVMSKAEDAKPYVEMFNVHFELANLGNCDKRMAADPHSRSVGSKEYPVKMEEHYLMKSVCEVSQVPIVLTVSTYRGRLMWTLVYNPLWISRKFATKYIDQLAAVLRYVTLPEEDELESIDPFPNHMPPNMPNGQNFPPPKSSSIPQAKAHNLPPAVRARMMFPNGR